jgi:hypothetical protein
LGRRYIELFAVSHDEVNMAVRSNASLSGIPEAMLPALIAMGQLPSSSYTTTNVSGTSTGLMAPSQQGWSGGQDYATALAAAAAAAAASVGVNVNNATAASNGIANISGSTPSTSSAAAAAMAAAAAIKQSLAAQQAATANTTATAQASLAALATNPVAAAQLMAQLYGIGGTGVGIGGLGGSGRGSTMAGMTSMGGHPPGTRVKLQGLPYRATRDDINTFFAYVMFTSSVRPHFLCKSNSLIVLIAYSGFDYIETSIEFGVDGSGRSNGEAFVLFRSPEAARAAASSKNGHYIGDRYVKLFVD